METDAIRNEERDMSHCHEYPYAVYDTTLNGHGNLIKTGEQCLLLDVFRTLKDAEEFIDHQPDAWKGMYAIDGPYDGNMTTYIPGYELCAVCGTPLDSTDEGGHVHLHDGHEDHVPERSTPKLDALMRGENMWPGPVFNMDKAVDSRVLDAAIEVIRERHPEMNDSTKPAGARVVVRFLERERDALKQEAANKPWLWER